MIYQNRSRLQIKSERLKTSQIIKQMSFHIIDNEVKAAISWTIASSYPQVNFKENRDYLTRGTREHCYVCNENTGTKKSENF